MAEVKADVVSNPKTAIWKIGRENGWPQMTARRLVMEDLGPRSFVKRRTQLITKPQRQKRKDRATKILNLLKRNASGKVFSDKRDWHLEKHHNRENRRYLATSPASMDPTTKYVGRAKFSQKVMCLGVVMSDGQALPLFWFDGSLKGKRYKGMLAHKVLPILDYTYGKGRCIWVRDGASSPYIHKASRITCGNNWGQGGLVQDNMDPKLTEPEPPRLQHVGAHREHPSSAMHKKFWLIR